MSGEFGDYGNCGYFDSKIRNAAEDAEGGHYPFTRLWAKFLRPLAEVARAIAYNEAGDSGDEYPLRATWEKLPELRSALWQIEGAVRVVDLAMVDGARAVTSELPTPLYDAQRQRISLLVPRSLKAGRVLDALLLRHVEDFAHRLRLEGKPVDYSWRLASSGGACDAAAWTYTYEPRSRDSVARAALEEVRGILGRGGTVDEVRAVVDAVPIVEERP